jgi:hypothetical protein
MKAIYKCRIIFPLLIFVIVVSCQSSKIGVSKYQKNPIIVDGSSSEWKDTLQYDYSSKIWYSLTNDSTNIYVRLMFVDESLQQKVRKLGLTVWFDTTACKKKLFGIGFPVKHEPGQEGQFGADDAPGNRNKKGFEDDPLSAMQQDVEVFGYSSKNDYRKYVMSESPFKPSIGKGEFNSTIYELAIPLKELFKNRKYAFGKVLSVGFITGKMELPNMEKGGMPERGEMPGGGMGSEGGGMGGGRGMHSGGGRESGSTPRNMESMQQEIQLWIKTYTIISLLK